MTIVEKSAARASQRPSAHAVREPAKKAVALKVVNGRLVGPSLADPLVKREADKSMAVHRKSVDTLRDYYIKAGVITKGGKLTKRYGG